MKKTIVCFIGGMIGVVQCFFCMAEEVTAKKGTGLWRFDLASCEKIQRLIGGTDAHYIEKLCGQSSEELAADIAIMQVILLGKQLEQQQNLLQQKNVVLDIGPDKIKEIAQKMYLPEDSVNESPMDKGRNDGSIWKAKGPLGKFGKWLEIHVNYNFCYSIFDGDHYRTGVDIGADPKNFLWLSPRPGPGFNEHRNIK